MKTIEFPKVAEIHVHH